MNTIIIYHADCFDGIAGAWVIKYYLAMNPDGNKHFLFPARHGDDPPSVDGDSVIYMVDFSYPRPVMNLLLKRTNGRMRVFDHHKTAQEALANFPNAVFDMDRSGAGISWDELFKGSPRPLAIDLVEDRDLWRFNREATRPFIASLASRNLTPTNFQYVVNDTEKFIEEGYPIVSYIEQYGEKLAETSVVCNIAGHDVPVINCPYMNISDHLDVLLKHYPLAPFAAAFFQRHDKTRTDTVWQFSLRSKVNGLDVSEIAKKFGGGGHRNAAGFQVQSLTEVGWWV